ncbi:hypothetical protein CROQUDRAFT_504512 [Cronartium quercuum f. sp. fusiforme G11]|uniref:Transmembrane protein n=1 Tax=Cronartium quercuum f. sp. fusiforme G11 TaxID=708437 RepID=A0A9P6NY51_9BASI|nr:hypothetical protein CROQUDRAFT_504512 [Cronartium quercuum f. sp. fusiforme G11]
MAQVERYQTDHQLNNIIDESTNLLTSSVPSKPGPELDSKFHHQGLPDPPQFINPPTKQNEINEMGKEGNSIEDNPQPPQQQQEKEEEEEEEQQISVFDEEYLNQLDEPESKESSMEKSQTEPINEVNTDGIKEIIEPDHSSTTKENLLIDEETSALEILSKEEEEKEVKSLSLDQIEPINDSKSIESLKESNELKEDEIVINDSIQKDQKINDPTNHKEKSINDLNDWTDITKSEVQFALCLFIIPWISILVTIKSINTIVYLIFDYQLIKPFKNFILFIFGPSLIYNSLLSVLISLLDQTI